MKINFASATLSKKVEALGAKLMEKYDTVGFNEDTGNADEDDIASIPK